MGTSHSAVGRTFIDAAGRRAVFYAANLPALGPDKSYQLWYLDEDEEKTSAGVFNADAQGKAALVIDQPLPLERIQGWVVTVEPRGGRPQPTGPMALAG
jgi:anti-sigma-K factor RskA